MNETQRKAHRVAHDFAEGVDRGGAQSSSWWWQQTGHALFSCRNDCQLTRLSHFFGGSGGLSLPGCRAGRQVAKAMAVLQLPHFAYAWSKCSSAALNLGELPWCCAWDRGSSPVTCARTHRVLYSAVALTSSATQIARRSREGILPLCSALLRPLLRPALEPPAQGRHGPVNTSFQRVPRFPQERVRGSERVFRVGTAGGRTPASPS